MAAKGILSPSTRAGCFWDPATQPLHFPSPVHLTRLQNYRWSVKGKGSVVHLEGVVTVSPVPSSLTSLFIHKLGCQALRITELQEGKGLDSRVFTWTITSRESQPGTSVDFRQEINFY